MEITTAAAHGLSTGDYVKFVDDSLTFTCAKDDHGSDHSYPRTTDPSSNKWLSVTVIDGDQFTVNVGEAGDATAGIHTFVTGAPNGILIAQNTIGVSADGLTFTCDMDGHSTNHSYPRTTDPAYNAVFGIEAVNSDKVTINVGSSPLVNHNVTDATYNAGTCLL